MKADYLVEFAGITNNGPQDAEHPNAFPMLGFSQSVSNPHDPVLGPSGRADISDLTVARLVDGATTTLLRSSATNLRFDKATIYCRVAGTKQKDFLTVEMDEVVVTAITISTAPGDDGRPMERTTLGFAKVKYTFGDQSNKGDVGGKVDFSYNHADNQ